jgi:hypothetical protein
MFARAQMIEPGTSVTAVLDFADNGSPCPVLVTVDTTDPYDRFVELFHSRRDGSVAPEIYRVPLEATPQPFGGVRWWFLCPRTGRRCMKLYLPFGGHRFLSREGWGLDYDCQQENSEDRAQRQAIKAYRALRGEGNWRNAAPPKPKWMRWPTYNRLADRLDQCNDAFDAGWMVSFSRLQMIVRGRSR